MRTLASYLLGSLAVAGIVGATMLLVHALDTSMMIILFNVLTTLVIVCVATLIAATRGKGADMLH